MRPAVVLIIVGLALLATALVRHQEEASFDVRFQNAEERIRALADNIDEEMNDPDQD